MATARSKALGKKEHKHTKTDEAGLCKSCGYNTLQLPNKELNKKYGYKKF